MRKYYKIPLDMQTHYRISGVQTSSVVDIRTQQNGWKDGKVALLSHIIVCDMDYTVVMQQKKKSATMYSVLESAKGIRTTHAAEIPSCCQSCMGYGNELWNLTYASTAPEVHQAWRQVFKGLWLLHRSSLREGSGQGFKE